MRIRAEVPECTEALVTTVIVGVTVIPEEQKEAKTLPRVEENADGMERSVV